MKTLVIVESPTKGEKIEHYLGKGFKVIATKGHIADLAKGGKHGLGVDLENGFTPRYVLMEDKYELMNTLIAEAEKADRIWVASDPDREGEAIAWHVASRLQGCKKEIKRVEFHEITKAGIAEGAKNPREINLNLFHAQESRRILDRIVGFMASPFLMNFFGPKLSAGRVQSVVTKIIVDREREIEAFVPEEYWNIKACLTKDGKESFWTKYDPKVTNQAKALEVKKLLEGDKLSATYIVSQIIAKPEPKAPNPPMITSQLQRVMAKSFGFAADQTMRAAQSLYENGYVTYIRTDSVRTEPEAVKAVREWLKTNKFEVPKTATTFKTKGAAQDAHECIRPTNLDLGPKNKELSGDEAKVYEIIWKYFVGSQMSPAIYDTMKVTIHLKGDKDAVMKVSGKALKKPGFLEIMGVTDDSKIDIPNLTKGDELTLFGKIPVTLEKKQTQPPARFSVFSIIEEMEKRDIGRPATYAETISKITARNYVEMEGKSYRPTDLGKTVTDALSKFFTFMSYDYTAEMEEKLDAVEHGKENMVQMLQKFYDPFKIELSKAYVSNGSTLCDNCKSAMVIRTTKDGNKFLGCSAYPRCKTTKQIDN